MSFLVDTSYLDPDDYNDREAAEADAYERDRDERALERDDYPCPVECGMSYCDCEAE
jgi:hypothetical protein